MLKGPWRLKPIPLNADPAPFVAPDLDDRDWPTVPEATHLQLHLHPQAPYWGEHLRRLNEYAWVYRRRIPPSFIAPAKRYRLRFDGVDYYASVWLDGAHVGRHEGGFVPFTLGVTDHLHPDRDSILAVVVSAPWDPPAGGSSPVDHVLRGMVKGLYEHAEGVIPPDVNPIGVWAPVHLLIDRGISIEGVRVRTAVDGTLHVAVTVENVTGAPRPLRLELQVRAQNHDGPGLSTAMSAEALAGLSEVERELHLNRPRLWWPWDQGTTNLYTVEARLSDEAGQPLARRRETFGVREVHLERGADRFVYHINGRPVFVRGTSYIPDLYLSRVTQETLARDFDLLMEAGLNLARLHVHVSPKALYRMADRRGVMIWQDFELNWLHDYSANFEARALALQRAMFRHLGNHPSIITWCCHNEPTMLLVNRENLLLRPDPALYKDALQQDRTRPIFICSGQREHDYERSGDVHTYYGAIWSRRFTDVYHHPARLNTEFGFEAPADPRTLRAWPDLLRRTRHLVAKTPKLWNYQAELTRFHVERYRRLRFAPCGGYVHFMLADLAPGVGCGALDSMRLPKGGYGALKRASQPVHFFMEHDGERAIALWVVNDRPRELRGLTATWRVLDEGGQAVVEGEESLDLPAGTLLKVAEVAWDLGQAAFGCTVVLRLLDEAGEALVHNVYRRPFSLPTRPEGYPWNYDPYLGVKVFDQPGVRSIVGWLNNPLLRPLAPLVYAIAEWGLRQELPPRLAHRLSQFIEILRGRRPLSEL
jgi:beta-mannosidase